MKELLQVYLFRGLGLAVKGLGSKGELLQVDLLFFVQSLVNIGTTIRVCMGDKDYSERAAPGLHV